MGSLSGLPDRVLIGGNPCVMLGGMDALELLAGERARTEVRLAALRSDFAGMVAASVSSNADDEHDPEGATIAFERSQVDALLRAAERQLVEVDAAVARVHDGTYGVCSVCGSPIPSGRLEARPTTTTCVAHA